MRPLLIIGGATGTGKSDIAVECAKKLNGEIVSTDSMQIYRGLNIGTAKIRKEEMQGIVHHMIDIVDPHDSFTAADFKRMATMVIEDIISRAKVPILCGGTGLYINSVLYDMSFSGKFDPVLREKLLAERNTFGKEYMHKKLASIDPVAANRLHVNDEKRVIRAIEKALTGGEAERDLAEAKYPYLFFITDIPRDVMFQRIDRRVEKMMVEGLKAEVDGLLKSGIGFDRQCMQAIAYKEWAYCLSNELSESEVVELIKKNTRNYAKRQVTWFKQYKDAYKINVNDVPPQVVAEEITKKYNEAI